MLKQKALTNYWETNHSPGIKITSVSEDEIEQLPGIVYRSHFNLQFTNSGLQTFSGYLRQRADVNYSSSYPPDFEIYFQVNQHIYLHLRQ